MSKFQHLIDLIQSPAGNLLSLVESGEALTVLRSSDESKCRGELERLWTALEDAAFREREYDPTVDQRQAPLVDALRCLGIGKDSDA